MKKRLISLVLVLTMVLTLVPVQAFATDTQSPSENPFADVQAGNWFYDNVMYCFENGLFSGVTTTEFAPQGTMTRGMFVTVLGRMAEVDQAEYQTPPPFTDVSPTSVFAPYIAWAAAMGITSGKGDGTFDPNGLVTREQMATFIVRYFDKYEIPFPEATVTSQPRDFDKVAEFAKESVLKLWGCGLFQGDTWGNFNPKNNATRAEAAAFCSRSDLVIEQWFIDTGAKEEGEKEETTPAKKPSSGGGSYGGSSTTTRNYKVTFSTNGETSDKLYPQGTVLSTLVPQQPNGQVFLGWYEDSACTTPIDSKATLTKDVTLYANFAAATKLDESGTQNFASALNQEPEFSVKVPGATASDFTFRDVSHPDHKVQFNGESVEQSVTIDSAGIISSATGGFVPGHTYQIELTNDSLIFDEDYSATANAFAEAKNANKNLDIAKVRLFNFSIAKNGTMNLLLSNDIKYIAVEDNTISAADVAGLMQYQGLYLATTDTSGDTVYTANSGTGSFTYTGNDINVGDIVSLYEGTKPNERKPEKDTGLSDKTDNGDVVYVKITQVNESTYSYIAAEAEEVLFTPDIIPMDVDDGDGTTGWTENGTTVTVDNAKLVFDSADYAEMGLTSETVVEQGDYLVFYTGTFGVSNQEPIYGKITNVERGELGTTTITYALADSGDVYAAMDLYDETELTQEQIDEAINAAKKEASEIVQAQLEGSGFFDDAGLYLAEASLLTEEVRDVFGDDLTMKDVTVTYADGTPVGSEDLELMGNLFGDDDDNFSVNLSSNLDYFEKDKGTLGIRVEVTVGYDFEIQKEGNKNKLEIALQAVFEQELIFGFGVSGGAEWKRKWIFPYIDDYTMTGSLDLGTYTGIAISATASLSEDEEEFGMPFPDDDSDESLISDKILNLGESIQNAMEDYETVMPDAEGSAAGGLADKYADFMEGANDAWVDLFEVPIVSQEGTIDPIGILAYSVNVDFVVSANFNVALGFTFHYVNHKRQTFSLKLFSQESTSDTVDVATNGYQFDFYVMGTIGIRAGIRVKALMGLFSTRMAGIGLQIEVGAYAQLWGYFYYSLSNWKDKDTGVWDKNSSWSGALYIEIGAYVDIKFIAEALNGKFTFAPTLYGDQFPFWHAGQRENVYDFNYEDDMTLNMTNVNTYTLPTSYYDMAWMDMKTGETEGNVKNFDAADNENGNEKNFAVEFTNDEVFQYDPTNNKITITPDPSIFEYETDLKLTWLGAPLAGSSETLQRTVDIHWQNVGNIGTFVFETNGGSAVDMLALSAGYQLTAADVPQNPTKQGYTFAGWYDSSNLTTQFQLEGHTMGIANRTLYAKWVPAEVTYTVEHYQRALNNRYVLADTETKTGLTEDVTAASGKDYEGFKPVNAFEQIEIMPDGSTTVELYYDRESYDVTYQFGNGSKDAVVSILFGAPITKPSRPFMQGYTFVEWNKDIPDTLTEGKNLTFVAQWELSTDTPYFVEHYKETLYGDFIRDYMESKEGTTDSQTNAQPMVYPGFTAPRSVTQKSIAGDGSTIIRIEYTRNAHELTWDAGEGTISSAANTYTNGTVKYGATIMAPGDVTRLGYEFDNWYYLNNGEETAFVPGTTNMPDMDCELYAKWNAGSGIAYKVEHYLQNLDGSYSDTPADTDTLEGITGEDTEAEKKTTYDGFTEPDSVTQVAIKADGTTVVRIEYQRNSYAVVWDFDGQTADNENYTHGDVLFETEIQVPTISKTGFDVVWYTDDACTTPLADGATVPVGGMNIYAKWEPKGDTAYQVKHYLQNLDGTYPTTPEKTDNKTGVTGANASATTETYEGFTAGTPEVKTIAADGSTVVRVEYTRNSHTLTWAENGGEALTGTPTTGNVKYGATITFPNEPTNTGYTFAGWSDGTNNYNTGATMTMPDDDVTMTAQWSTGEFTITFNLNGGDGSIAAITDDYNADITAPANPSRDGYDFAGWAKTQDGAVTGLPTKMPAANETYYAQWTAKTYQLTVDVAGGTGTATPITVTYDATFYASLPTLTKAGYTFAGWEIDNIAIAANDIWEYSVGKTAVAQWTAIPYTITFDSNGGSTVNPSTADYGDSVSKPTNPTKTGYTFAGWYTDTELQTAVVWPVNMPLDGATYYAKWTANKYTITFENGYDSNPIQTGSMDFGANLTAPSDPSREGYTFDGWSPTVPATVPAEDTTYTAQWKIEKYDVVFKIDVANIHKTVSYAYGATIAAPTAPTKENYTFKGWSTTADGLSPVDFGDSITVPVNGATYYAIWDADTYIVTLKYNDEVNEDTTIEVSFGGTYDTLPEDPTREYYAFLGWYYNNDTKVTDTSVLETNGDHTLTAKWENTLTIVTFYDGATQTTEGYVPGEGRTNDLIKDGYEFAGWSEQQTGGLATASKTFEVQENVNKVLYAYWRTVIDPEEVTMTGATEMGYNTNPWPGTIDKGIYSDLEFDVEYCNTYNNDTTNTPPTNTGNYEVRITREQDDTYSAFEDTFTFSIVQGTISYSQFNEFKCEVAASTCVDVTLNFTSICEDFPNSYIMVYLYKNHDYNTSCGSPESISEPGEVHIWQLDPSTTYEVKVLVSDRSGNYGEKHSHTLLTFTTPAPPTA